MEDRLGENRSIAGTFTIQLLKDHIPAKLSFIPKALNIFNQLMEVSRITRNFHADVFELNSAGLDTPAEPHFTYIVKLVLIPGLEILSTRNCIKRGFYKEGNFS